MPELHHIPPNNHLSSANIINPIMTPQALRWGILATGGIAHAFVKDLLIDPSSRDVKDVRHTVVAAASSSSKERATQFLKETGSPSDAQAYGSYAELVKDKQVDIIYVATPHSHHYQNVRLCLEAGKHVLCEKAFTVNAAQAKKLVEIAREKKLFLMEAVWTRYFPLSRWVVETVSSGTIGSVVKVFADNGIGLDLDKLDESHRLLNPHLAGGALLDSGIYALTWVFIACYSTQDMGTRKRPTVGGSTMTKTRTNVDESCLVVMQFPHDDQNVVATATTSLRVGPSPFDSGDKAGPTIRIQCTKGEIQVMPPAYRPTKTRLITSTGIEEKNWPQPGPGVGSGWKNGFGEDIHGEGEGHGMFWEADEAARAIAAGRLEASLLGWDESILIMEIMDEVRKEGDLVYPSNIESTDYPLDLD